MSVSKCETQLMIKCRILSRFSCNNVYVSKCETQLLCAVLLNLFFFCSVMLLCLPSLIPQKAKTKKVTRFRTYNSSTLVTEYLNRVRNLILDMKLCLVQTYIFQHPGYLIHLMSHKISHKVSLITKLTLTLQ